VTETKGLKQWSFDVYDTAASKGWHTSDTTRPYRETIAVYFMNIHAEISELWEAYRAGRLNEPCDKAEKMRAIGVKELTCLEEELADIVIRAFDSAYALGVDIEAAVEAKHAYNATRPQRHGGKLA